MAATKKWESWVTVWARWVLMTTAAVCIDGGILCFIPGFGYRTPFITPPFIPKSFYNTPFSIPGILALATGVLLPWLEFRTSAPAWAKALYCFIHVPVFAIQFTTVPPATFLFLSGIVMGIAALQRPPNSPLLGKA
ncbi:uncharacterized protein EV422DRAFT_569468 [Fimicolochytrium jonesii]|uniref:uncharacterized protein n=1 Tax=Fimicolochytrium jonesii TaxID=1396493 RepID=UPI0022FF1CD4|nr:uncharacterized protein EV422DRAFT_569468 [Fimicolochytrium jonesii]KAI8818805.1 hypothetical protein EV422DRAFT_569468 [Fimicolochytrium jonesii]